MIESALLIYRHTHTHTLYLSLSMCVCRGNRHGNRPSVSPLISLSCGIFQKDKKKKMKEKDCVSTCPSFRPSVTASFPFIIIIFLKSCDWSQILKWPLRSNTLSASPDDVSLCASDARCGH